MEYIYQENIEIVPLYFASIRKVIERDGMLLDVNDDRLKIFPNEKLKIKKFDLEPLDVTH